MKGCMSTDLGIITIDPEVIAKYEGWSGSSVKKREPDPWN